MKLCNAGLLAAVVLHAGTGCVDQEEIDYCIEDRVTIEGGVYGQLLHGCDTDDCELRYAAGEEVRVYDEDPTPVGSWPDEILYDTGTEAVPVQRVISDDVGFFEVSLAPGLYYLCSFTNGCGQVGVESGRSRVRSDFVSDPTGVNWWKGRCDGPISPGALSRSR